VTTAPPLETRRRRAGAAAWFSKNRGLLVVVAGFATSAFLVPTLAPVAINDDPLYARSVEILLRHGRLEVLPLVVTSLVGQVLWAAPFAWVFGDSLGVMRTATVVAVGLSAFPMYVLLRELHITRNRSAIGTALYLFNPLTYSLTFTFMSDAYLLAGVVASAACFVRGLGRDGPDSPWVVVGSLIAGLTFMVRQQAVFVIVAVVLVLLIDGELSWSRRGLRRTVRAVAPFAVLAGLYLFWFHVVHGVPPDSAQAEVTQQWFRAEPLEVVSLMARLTFIAIMYAALLLLPLLGALVPALRSLVRNSTRTARTAMGAWVGVIALGLLLLGNGQARMPYISQFVGVSGLGPPDLRGSNFLLLTPKAQDLLTLVCAAGATVLGVVLFAGTGRRPRRRSPDAIRLVVALLLGQAVAVVVSSYPFRDSAISRDRYLLPLVPLVIAVVLWCARSSRLAAPVACVGVALFAAVSIAGVHDFLTFQSEVWETANAAHGSGIPRRDIDAGAGWDAYHLNEYSSRHPARADEPARLRPDQLRGLQGLKPSPHDIAPWWIDFYAPADTSRYVVSGEPLLGYRVISSTAWYSWLHHGARRVYLLERTPSG
jgi:4-amino-4-deoxy-L-arabinose transferase-like glycosyltransferase